MIQYFDIGGMNIVYSDQRLTSHGTSTDLQRFHQRLEHQLHLPDSTSVDKYPIPSSTDKREGGSSQPLKRTRALLTAEKARDIFKLRGRLAASERESGNFSSLFTARSILVSQVFLHNHAQTSPDNTTTMLRDSSNLLLNTDGAK